jgi:hypothetical protein
MEPNYSSVGRLLLLVAMLLLARPCEAAGFRVALKNGHTITRTGYREVFWNWERWGNGVVILNVSGCRTSRKDWPQDCDDFSFPRENVIFFEATP